MIVQCAAKRSGNYLLWRILHGILGRATSYDAFYGSESKLVEPVGFTHRLPAEVPNGIYLVRDGRDAVHSLFQFVVTPEYRARHPDCVRTDVRELLELPGFLERRVEHWRAHVASYLADRRPWYLVRYEELLGPEKRATVARLARHLGRALDDTTLDAILGDTTVEACRRSAPGHVHAGTRGQAAHFFAPEHLACIERLAGRELAALGYAPARLARAR